MALCVIGDRRSVRLHRHAPCDEVGGRFGVVENLLVDGLAAAVRVGASRLCSAGSRAVSHRRFGCGVGNGPRRAARLSATCAGPAPWQPRASVARQLPPRAPASAAAARAAAGPASSLSRMPGAARSWPWVRYRPPPARARPPSEGSTSERRPGRHPPRPQRGRVEDATADPARKTLRPCRGRPSLPRSNTCSFVAGVARR